MIITMLQGYGLDQFKPSSIPMEANLIVGPDPHRDSREKIQFSPADPNASAGKALQSKFDQIESGLRLRKATIHADCWISAICGHRHKA
jgi:hypothetical protein